VNAWQHLTYGLFVLRHPLIPVLSLALLGSIGCAQNSYVAPGAILGGAVGTGIGIATSPNRPAQGGLVGALIGAALGGVGGYALGNSRQSQQPQPPQGQYYPAPNQEVPPPAPGYGYNDPSAGQNGPSGPPPAYGYGGPQPEQPAYGYNGAPPPPPGSGYNGSSGEPQTYGYNGPPPSGPVYSYNAPVAPPSDYGSGPAPAPPTGYSSDPANAGEGELTAPQPVGSRVRTKYAPYYY
jgi:hypothetical protein